MRPVDIQSIAILPWLDIREPIAIGDVTFYRADSVADILGEKAALLADRLRVYKDGQTGLQSSGAVALHQDQLANGGPAPYAAIRRATDILMMAAMFNNDGELVAQNATTFELFSSAGSQNRTRVGS